ncbi:MAG: 16S rRNA (guanine(527)-N(7))-methyltransferase RsmG [Bacteroidales bacterium]|jgi:16S rRNA (guanine527-N7)-methyltransferase
MLLIEKYFPFLSADQKDRFIALGPLYKDWNQKINVISRRDIGELCERHVLHSLSIAKYTSFRAGQTVLDIGTGGGFPGIPLAILFPEVRFILSDSVQKKIRVVEAIAKTLQLENVEPVPERAEKIRDVYEVAVCRAVAPLPELIRWTRKTLETSSEKNYGHGLIALKGGELSKEIDRRYKTTITDISNYFEEPFFRTKKIVHVTFS